MRYIGNKTKLIGFIGEILDENQILSGTAIDAFSGTASVGRYLKRRGMGVRSCDLMTYSFVFQKAYVELDKLPSFAEVISRDTELRRVISGSSFRTRLGERFGVQTDLFGSIETPASALKDVLVYLEHFLPPHVGFVTRHYAPCSDETEPGDRMFFTRENAQRIDAIRRQVHEWRIQRLLEDTEYYLLLAILLEAADSVANTTGVYAAYVKTWQGNALRPIRMEPPVLTLNTGLDCAAYQGDVSELIPQLGEADLLYLDPPYNTRQYASYYHVPELLARGWFALEPEIRGKTGLIDDADKKSRWSTRSSCVDALNDLVENARARYVLMSYNSEGIIPEDDIRRIFCEHGDPTSYRVYERAYQRYRSDSDHEQRSYKADSVTEKIYFARIW